MTASTQPRSNNNQGTTDAERESDTWTADLNSGLHKAIGVHKDQLRVSSEKSITCSASQIQNPLARSAVRVSAGALATGSSEASAAASHQAVDYSFPSKKV